MGLLIIFCSVAVFISFFCSLFEATLLTITQSYIQNLNKKNPKIALLIKKQKDNIESPLIAILTLNTLSHTLGAATAGAQAANVFGDEYVGLFSAFLTICILYISEIIPKTIGANYWREIAPFMSVSVNIMEKITLPLIKFSKIITKKIKKSRDKNSIRQDIMAMVTLGNEDGVIEEQELTILRNILDAKEIKISSIMTPRTVVFSIDANATVRDFISKYSSIPFSKIPIYEENPENITGYVNKLEIIEEEKYHSNKKIITIKKNIMTMIYSIKLLSALQKMLKYKAQIAIIVDEYGTIMGIVTMEDIIESLLGLEIIESKDIAEDMQSLARFLWKKRIKEKGIVIYEDKDIDKKI